MLDMAACCATVDDFKLLLQHGADLTYSTPLHSAAMSRADQISMMEYLIDELKIDVDTDDGVKGLFRSLGPPIHHAVRSGGLENVKYLVKREADLERRGRLGRTPLGEAERTANEELKEFLRGLSDHREGKT